MKHQIVISWLLLLISQSILLAEGKEAERAVVKVEETKRGRKITTDYFVGKALVRKQVEEQRTGKKPLEAKYTRYYRDGEEVLFEYWDSKSKETVRYFTQEKRTVMAELDRNGDGLFEWVVLFGNDEKVLTVFKRNNETIEVLDRDALEKFKVGSGAAREFFGK